jgi:hypothetical protein
MEVHIARRGGDHFATLAPLDRTSSAYSVETIGSKRYQIEGQLKHHSLHVRDAAGKCLAKATPCRAYFDEGGEYYVVRSASLVDVGLVICSLLSLDHLQDGLV